MLRISQHIMKKNTFVQFVDPKTQQVRCGVVLGMRGGKLCVLLSDKRTLVSGPPRMFTARNEPVPEFFPPPFAKGDTVEFTANGVTKLGVVERVNATQAVVICDGGCSKIQGHPWQFKLSPKSLACEADDGLMSEYSVKAYRVLRGHGDVPAYSATVFHRGRRFAEVLNDGWGGPSSCQPCSGVEPREMRRFEEAVDQWVREAGEKDVLFALESWIDWFANFRPYGMTASEYFRD